MPRSQGRQGRPPHLIASQHGIEDDEELPHARREHDLRRLALRQEADGTVGLCKRVSANVATMTHMKLALLCQLMNNALEASCLS
jgi:hypothetical protein